MSFDLAFTCTADDYDEVARTSVQAWASSLDMNDPVNACQSVGVEVAVAVARLAVRNHRMAGQYARVHLNGHRNHVPGEPDEGWASDSLVVSVASIRQEAYDELHPKPEPEAEEVTA